MSCCFCIIRPPPGSTLFPYTTLFRSGISVRSSSSADLASTRETSRATLPLPITATCSASRGQVRRSEEHTSELQSRGHLVCRLLLEKQKKILHTAQRAAVIRLAAHRH